MTSLREARNILAVRLDAMGDLIMTGPALRALASHGARVALLTSPAGAAIAPLLDGVAEVIAYEAPWMKATTRSGEEEDLAMIERLREGNYDVAVIFTVRSQSALPAALLCRLAGIPRRAAHSRDKPYGLLTEWIPDPEPAIERHEVERQLALTRSLGFDSVDDRLRLRLPADAWRRADRLVAALGIAAESGWVLLHPGASAPSRRYPLDRYAQVVATLTRDCGRRVLVAGGADEVDAAAELVRQTGGAAVSVAGRLDLAAYAALTGRAGLFIGNNSGPAHIAAAMGTPSVILYALTNPQHTPWGVPARVLSHDVPCRNCERSACPMGHHRCLLGVSPETVVAAALDLAQERVAIPA